MKGKKLMLEYEDKGRNDVELSMETEEPDRIIMAMQLTALEAARVDMERREAQRRDEDRIEEEREKEKTGFERCVDHDVMLADKTPGEIFLNDTLPVKQERLKLLLTLQVLRMGTMKKCQGADQPRKGKRQSRKRD